MLHKDIIILVIASRGHGYDKMINHCWSNAIRYIKQHNYSIKIYLLFGNDVETNDLQLHDDDKLILATSESYIPGILNKTMDAFNIVNELYTYKHVIRTNLSSVYILDNLIKVSNAMNDNNIYNGISGIYDNHISFVSGACAWLSKDNIDYMLENQDKLRRDLPDDVAIGEILKNKKSEVLLRYDVFDFNDHYIEVVDKHALLDSIKQNNHYHIRIASHNMDMNAIYSVAFAAMLYPNA
jgi:hypothetical protein